MTEQELSEKRYSFTEAMNAAKVVIDKFYDSGFNPTIDYEQLFSEALLNSDNKDNFV